MPNLKKILKNKVKNKSKINQNNIMSKINKVKNGKK